MPGSSSTMRIFGFIGAYFTVWLGPVFLRMANLAMPVEEIQSGIFSLHFVLWAVPGFLVGLVLGCVLRSALARVEAASAGSYAPDTRCIGCMLFSLAGACAQYVFM